MSQTQLPHDQPLARGRQFIYRLRQFFQGLHARITPAEQQMIVHVLPERAAAPCKQQATNRRIWPWRRCCMMLANWPPMRLACT